MDIPSGARVLYPWFFFSRDIEALGLPLFPESSRLSFEVDKVVEIG